MHQVWYLFAVTVRNRRSTGRRGSAAIDAAEPRPPRPLTFRHAILPVDEDGYAVRGLSIFDRYQNPLFVIDQDRMLIYRNDAGARIIGTSTGFAEKNGKLRLGGKVDAALEQIISAGHTLSGCRGLRLSPPHTGRDWLLLVHLLGRLPDRSAGRAFLLHAIGRTRVRNMPFRALKDLFGLTVREITVIQELLANGKAQTVANRLSLSHETIRSHLKRIFRKCNVHSKTELSALLQRVAEFVP